MSLYMAEPKVARNRYQHYQYHHNSRRHRTCHLHGVVAMERQQIASEPCAEGVVDFGRVYVAWLRLSCMVVVDQTSLSTPKSRGPGLGSCSK